MEQLHNVSLKHTLIYTLVVSAGCPGELPRLHLGDSVEFLQHDKGTAVWFDILIVQFALFLCKKHGDLA